MSVALVIVSTPAPPAIPVTVASASVRASLRASPEEASPVRLPATSSDTATPLAWESASRPISPSARPSIVSAPSPPSMPVAWVVARLEALLSAEPSTSTLGSVSVMTSPSFVTPIPMPTPTEVDVARASASMSVALVIWSVPAPPAIPVDRAAAVVVDWLKAVPFETSPLRLPATESETATPVAVEVAWRSIVPAVAVSRPIVSSSSPPSIPVADASALTRASLREEPETLPSFEICTSTPTPTPAASAPTSATMSPV